MRITAIIAVAMMVCASVSIATAGTTTVTFGNNAPQDINDLHVHLSHDCTGTTQHSPPPPSTPTTVFPTVTGYGSSTIHLKGASVGNPGACKVTFTGANGISVTSADWTKDGQNAPHDPTIVTH